MLGTAMACLVLAAAMAGCKGTQTAAGSAATGKIERKPIVERNEEQLKNETMMIDAKMMEETGRMDEAAQRYAEVLSRDPQNAAAMYELSRLMAARGMADSAIALSRRAMAADRGNVWYALHMATLYKLTHRTKEYIETWKGIVELQPEVLDYYYELSNAYLMDKDLKNALATLNRIERKVGVTEQVSTQKAKLWTAMGRNDKATQEIEALAEAMPQESRYSSILAETYMSQGKYDKAKQCYDRVLQTNPDDEYIHISLAEYYKAVGQPRKAYDELRISMAQKNLSTSNKLHILTNFYTSEEFYGIYSQYTYDLLDVAMRDCDDSTSFAALYGDVLMRKKQYREAAHQFALSLSADSSHYEVWEALLAAEMSAEIDTAQMGDHARRASRLFPLHPLPYYIQSVIEHDNERYERAIEFARRCEQLGFDNGYLEPDTYLMLADCYNRMDDSRCYEYYEKFLKLYPNDANALNSYAYRLAVDRKELDKAERMSLQSLKAEPDNPYFLDTYAWILHQMGRNDEARTYIEKAIQREKDDISDEVQEHYKAIMGK
jgi:tetratricopeptide (TPR) repeat protein